LVRVTTLESPYEPYIAAYPLLRGDGPPKEVIERIRADEARLLADLLPEADENTRYCYRWMLLDNLVHELNMLRGALGEPTRINFASLDRNVVELSLTYGSTKCHLSWVDLPGMARYSQELVFYGLDKRLTLDRKSTRLNSSHLVISYAVFCLKKKTTIDTTPTNEESVTSTLLANH